MRWLLLPCATSLLTLLVSGCVTAWRSDYISPKENKPFVAPKQENLRFSPNVEDKILALDADNVSELEVREVLSQVPAPRIMNLHGGVPFVVRHMISFSKFLEGMGYPESSLRNPRNGTYSFNCYMSSEKLAGAVAWYYEQEGLRPMLIGHSQGGFQTIRILHQLAGHYADEIPVYSPLSEQVQDRCEIIDPVTGEPLPVTKVSVCYASVIGTGGMARLMPHNWTLTGKVHTVPDSAEAFTGYYMGLDIIGGDFVGFGPANHFKANGLADIRNVQLPTGNQHVTAPETKHLLEDPEIVKWINDYTPTNRPKKDVSFQSNSSHLLLAADAWHQIKKHWVLELQRVICAQREAGHGH